MFHDVQDGLRRNSGNDGPTTSVEPTTQRSIYTLAPARHSHGRRSGGGVSASTVTLSLVRWGSGAHVPLGTVGCRAVSRARQWCRISRVRHRGRVRARVGALARVSGPQGVVESRQVVTRRAAPIAAFLSACTRARLRTARIAPAAELAGLAPRQADARTGGQRPAICSSSFTPASKGRSIVTAGQSPIARRWPTTRRQASAAATGNCTIAFCGLGKCTPNS